MKPAKNKVIVEIDYNHKKVVKLKSGLELIRPDMWEFEPEAGREERKYVQNLNRKDVNPQIAKVKAVYDGCRLRVGQDIFLHYLAVDNAIPIKDIDGKEYSLINENAIFFIIHGEGDFEMMDDIYLGEQVYSGGQTESGIWVTPYDKKKETLRVMITHVPKNSRGIRVGDTVLSIDDNQYILEIDGKKYIKLIKEFIVGKFVDEDNIKALA